MINKLFFLFFLFSIVEDSANIKENIIKCRVEKTLKTFTLLNQACIRDQNITVEEFIKNHVSLLGENIQLSRFTKFELGETAKDEE
mgnify:CR=1 FL=1